MGQSQSLDGRPSIDDGSPFVTGPGSLDGGRHRSRRRSFPAAGEGNAAIAGGGGVDDGDQPPPSTTSATAPSSSSSSGSPDGGPPPRRGLSAFRAISGHFDRHGNTSDPGGGGEEDDRRSSLSLLRALSSRALGNRSSSQTGNNGGGSDNDEGNDQGDPPSGGRPSPALPASIRRRPLEEPPGLVAMEEPPSNNFTVNASNVAVYAVNSSGVGGVGSTAVAEVISSPRNDDDPPSVPSTPGSAGERSLAASALPLPPDLLMRENMSNVRPPSHLVPDHSMVQSANNSAVTFDHHMMVQGGGGGGGTDNNNNHGISTVGFDHMMLQSANNSTVSFETSPDRATYHRAVGGVGGFEYSEYGATQEGGEHGQGHGHDQDQGSGGYGCDFFPTFSQNHEWMARSVESLILGHRSSAPILALPDDADDPSAAGVVVDVGGDFFAFRRRSTVSTFGGGPDATASRRRSSQGSFPGGRRGSLSLSGGNAMHGGTLASYYSNRRQRQVPTDVDRTYYGERQGRRGSTNALGPMYRRRSSLATSPADNNHEAAGRGRSGGGGGGGPNVLLSVTARESTGKSWFSRGVPAAQCLREMGGSGLYLALDKPAAGMATEVAFLAAAIDAGDWSETHTIISRLAPRLIGDPSMPPPGGGGGPGSDPSRWSAIDDPTLPPTAPRFYAGGGRLGLERDAFVLAGGVEVLMRIFREKSFVGQEMSNSYDARDLSEEIVANRLAQCWNEALASLRELVYAVPALVDDGTVSDQGDFLPFLFTLLSHDSCFDGAAALIEEVLSLMSQSPQQVLQQQDSSEGQGTGPGFFPTAGRAPPATTFFLGNVPDLYRLWGGFNCRQLAHFCRILALLVFEPEDRQLLESPAVLKSLELLQLRRNRAVRAGRDSTVDMNQAILLGDEQLIRRLLDLLRVMNFAPSLRRFSPYHVMASFPFIADTLVMLGLGELDSWEEIGRQETLARKLLDNDENFQRSPEEPSEPLLSELGAVADMLENLAATLMGNQREPSNQLGHIIHVISAAQQAGVIVGRPRRTRQRNQGRSPSNDSRQDDPSGSSLSMGGVPIDGATMQGLASVAGILTDQVLVRRLYQSTGQDYEDNPANNNNNAPVQVVGLGVGPGPDVADGRRGAPPRHLINTPEDAANSLQFNAMLLGPYQVEVLFVLCTLLGGRRKLDAQDMLNRLRMVPILDDMFERLPWHKRRRNRPGGGGDDDPDGGDDELSDAVRESEQQQQPNGIHGPGCECTPESALCVQYLRLLHNFCDRDCDNYAGRRLLLSESEREYIFGGGGGGTGRQGAAGGMRELKPGLLSKITDAFIRESDESPYRFWLASCIESYLRGSSPGEQMFAAQSGLMAHLVEDISSERLHCAGSLQTSFDLLGELGKGNSEVVQLLVHDLNEESFRKLMSVAAANLVDSNVFIRSLLLSLERLSAADRLVSLYLDAGLPDLRNYQSRWRSQTGSATRSYLTHSWWDTCPIPLTTGREVGLGEDTDASDAADDSRQSDWFPSSELVLVSGVGSHQSAMLPAGLEESVGHFGWVFTPAGEALSANAYLPNTVERLSWFLAANQARLLRDLLGVVDLRNINHENICCLNTAVVIAIFAHRRMQLSALLHELRQMSDEEKESKRRAALDAARQDDVVDRAFVQAMRYLDLEHQRETPPYARRASLTGSGLQQIGDRTDVMRNFREVLWFWMEYYTHRGRDRLSLEFSSHIRFQEWNHVVSLLAADDGSPTSLVRAPVRLPLSPYQRAARVPPHYGRLVPH